MDTYPKKIDALEYHLVEDGFVAYDIGNDQVHFLNNTAYVVFELCNGKRSIENIAAYMQHEFKLQEKPIEEVMNAINNFVEIGLIELAQ